jgi:hypothetical protein
VLRGPAKLDLAKIRRIVGLGMKPARRSRYKMEAMIAVVGNLLAGLGVISLFTATLRITRGK